MSTKGKTGLDAVTAKLKDLAAKANATDAVVDDIRQAILDKGVSVLATTTLAELPDKIREIFVMKTTESSPVGEIIAFMGLNAPEHYLLCDGATYPVGSYPLLEKFFKAQFGSVNYFGGDGTTTFAVPDLRGEFLRGSGSSGRTNQGSGANVGVHQDSTKVLKTIVRNGAIVTYPVSGENTAEVNGDSFIVQPDVWGLNNNVTSSKYKQDAMVTHYTTRPTNTAVSYCIKYEPTVVTDGAGGIAGNPCDCEGPLTEDQMTAAVTWILKPDTVTPTPAT